MMKHIFYVKESEKLNREDGGKVKVEGKGE